MAHATAIAPDTLIQSRCHLRKDCRGVFALMTPIITPAGTDSSLYLADALTVEERATAVAEKQLAVRQFGALQNDTGESTEKEAWTLAGSPAIASGSSESSSLWQMWDKWTRKQYKKGKNHKKTIQLSRRHQSSFPPDRYTQRYNAQGLPKVFRNISAPPVCGFRKPRIQPPRPDPEPLSSLARRP